MRRYPKVFRLAQKPRFRLQVNQSVDLTESMLIGLTWLNYGWLGGTHRSMLMPGQQGFSIFQFPSSAIARYIRTKILESTC
jgi:hypothetical protein